MIDVSMMVLRSLVTTPALLLVSFQPIEEIDEIIRRKVENAAISPLTAFGDPLHCSNSIRQFYQDRLFEPAWNPPTSAQLVSAIQEAGQEGLRPNDYHAQRLSESAGASFKTNLAKAEHDLLLTDAFLLYISHMLSGKVNPQTIDAEWHVVRREGNPVELLSGAIASGNVDKAIQDARPRHSGYEGLRKALQTLRSIDSTDWNQISAGATIKKGMDDGRIPAIRRRLSDLGDLEHEWAESPGLYDDGLFKAVRSFQIRHGLDSDGNIGTRTVGALSLSIEQRIRQVEANMERWRWLPQEFGQYYIKVNIAKYELDVFKDGRLVRSHKVITGKPYRRTPVFSAKMQYLVLNPTWTVPPGILDADVLPGVRKDPGYLQKKRITVLDGRGNPVNPSGIDWKSRQAKSYIYRQPPGPDNALGAVKFMFPNSFHVYLHDTPSKELFQKSERAFSSGCIRVNDPLALAEYLLKGTGSWNRNEIDRVVATQRTRTVHLKQQPNVHLLYWTAWAESDGIIHFHKDIYERDKPLLEQLKGNPPVQMARK